MMPHHDIVAGAVKRDAEPYRGFPDRPDGLQHRMTFGWPVVGRYWCHSCGGMITRCPVFHQLTVNFRHNRVK